MDHETKSLREMQSERLKLRASLVKEFDEAVRAVTVARIIELTATIKE